MGSLSRIYGNQYFEQVRTVTSKEEMPSLPQSNVRYIIDPPSGYLDMGAKSIEVPEGGLHFAGHGSGLSVIGSSEDNFTLFTGANAGNLFMRDMSISVTGSNSKVYGLTANTGNEAVEIVNFNYLNCSSLGELSGFRQGLESNTRRSGGKPELTLSGTWAGGFRITTSIVRGLDSDMSGSLFKSGSGFTMSSRFLTDMNCDLPTNASVADFSPANFTLPSLLQVRGGIFTRNGAQSSGDNIFFPNLDPEDVVCEWRNNQGLRNTFEGGRLTITSESETVISAINTFYDVAGTWSADDLQHFDSPANGQLRNLGTNPQEFVIKGGLIIAGTANNVLYVRLIKWDSSESAFVNIYTKKAVVNSLTSPRDVAIVDIDYSATIEQNDYIKLQVSNSSSTANVTIELDSFLQVRTR